MNRFQGEDRMADKEANAIGFDLPGLDPELIAASQRKNLEALQQANHVALEGARTVLQRQFEIGREVVAEMSTIFGTLGQPGGSPGDWVVRQVETSKKAIETSVASARALAELMTKVNTEALDVLAHRVSEGLDEVRDYARKRAGS
jgi:phasin family protein